MKGGPIVAKDKPKKQKTNLYFAKVEPKLDLIESWYRNGADDKIVASNLNVGYSTFLKYKSDHRELRERTIVGKEEADLKVESNLYMNATGYDYTEEVAIKCKRSYYDDKGKKVEIEHIETATIRKHHPAETMAQMYWLNNRRPANWSQKQKLELSGEAGVIINNDIPRNKTS